MMPRVRFEEQLYIFEESGVGVNVDSLVAKFLSPSAPYVHEKAIEHMQTLFE